MKRWPASARCAGACVIGGEEIFKLALPLAQRIYLTEVTRAWRATRSFPHSIALSGARRSASSIRQMSVMPTR